MMGCRETEFFALTNAASWLQPYGKFFMVSTPSASPTSDNLYAIKEETCQNQASAQFGSLPVLYKSTFRDGFLTRESATAMQEWYSGALIKHGADILDAVLPVVEASQPEGDTAKVQSPSLVGQHFTP